MIDIAKAASRRKTAASNAVGLLSILPPHRVLDFAMICEGIAAKLLKIEIRFAIFALGIGGGPIVAAFRGFSRICEKNLVEPLRKRLEGVAIDARFAAASWRLKESESA
ncbi:MAG: hypothetical protein ING19_17510 [Azospirillum sp.]|nr:hypothetical protein [Azospirillum sp.]